MKEYISSKQYINSNKTQRSAYLSRISDDRKSNLSINLLTVIESEILKRTEINKKHVITGIDFFNGAYIYIIFQSDGVIGHAFLSSCKEILTEMSINFESSTHGKAGLFIDKEEFLMNFEKLS